MSFRKKGHLGVSLSCPADGLFPLLLCLPGGGNTQSASYQQGWGWGLLPVGSTFPLPSPPMLVPPTPTPPPPKRIAVCWAFPQLVPAVLVMDSVVLDFWV